MKYFIRIMVGGTIAVIFMGLVIAAGISLGYIIGVLANYFHNPFITPLIFGVFVIFVLGAAIALGIEDDC